MNHPTRIPVAILLVSGIISFNSCTKDLPSVTTTSISDITQTSAVSGGNVTNNGGAEVTARGVCWSTTENPPTISSSKTSDGTGNGAFTSNIAGLLANTKYYLCAYATNSEGTGYGTIKDFTTNGNPPVAGFSASPTTITAGQSVQFTDQSTNTPTSWSWIFGDGSTSASQSPSHIYSSSGTYSVSLTTTNSFGSDAESKSNYITVLPQGVLDADGNVYGTVTIGTQVWLKENLKTTKYNDGTTAIPNVTVTEWENLIAGAYCWYNNDILNKTNYGAIYNWYAVNTGMLCPTGWHVPKEIDWTTLENYLINNGYNYDGSTSGNKIAKSLAATTLWNVSSTPGAVGNTDYLTYRNKTGFTAPPGGYRSHLGSSPFGDIGDYGTWWSATEDGAADAWARTIAHDKSSLDIYSNYKKDGFSVRCLKD